MKVSKRAIFFTLDALIAAMIILSGIVLISNYYISEQKVVNLNYLSDDLVVVLDTMQVSEINTTYVNDLILAGDITHLNNTILEQIGEFWANGEIALAFNFTRNVTEGLIPPNIGYGIWYDGEMIYQRTNPQTFVVSSKKIMSGLEKAKPLKGTVANARATQVVKNTTLVVPFHQLGSGWDDGWTTVEKQFEMPAYDIIHNATLHLAVHTDTSNNDVQFTLNGLCNHTRDDVTWRLNSQGAYGSINLTPCMQAGWNNLSFTRLNNNGYNAHLHPGTRLQIDYETSEAVDYSTDVTTTVSDRIYFDQIISYEQSGDDAGVFQIVPFVVPFEATDVNVYVQIAGRNVRNYVDAGSCWIWWPWWPNYDRCFWDWDGNLVLNQDHDVVVFLNDDDPIFIDATPAVNPTYIFDTATTAPLLRNGTNSLIVYFNNYGDYVWGDDYVELYSAQQADPAGSSFVEVNYTLPPISHYGQIRIQQSTDFGAVDAPTIQTSYQYPAEAIEWGDVYVNIAQQYSYLIRVRADADTNPPGTTIFQSVAGREVPTQVYIPNATLSLSPLSNNFVELQDTGGNDVVRESSIDYEFYVRSFVGFGDVFGTLAEAEADALLRLNATLGPFISLASAELASNNVTDVPSMWGPAVIEVRAWH